MLANPAVKVLCDRLQKGDAPLAVNGLWGSSAPILSGLISEHIARPILYLCAHLEQADNAQDDIESALNRPTNLFPAWETLPGEGAGAGEIGSERARVCAMLHSLARSKGKNGTSKSPTGNFTRTPTPPTPDASPLPILIAPIQALMQPVPTPASLEAWTLTLAQGEQRSSDTIARWLVDRGFERLDRVEQPGDFALRGGILDIFWSGDADPVRLDFFGDEIESIRQFDAATQRSVRDLPMVRITRSPEQGALSVEDTTSLFHYLPSTSIIVFHEPLDAAEVARTVLDRLGNPVGNYPFDAILRSAGGFTQLHMSRFPIATASDTNTFRVTCESLPPFDPKSTDAARQLLAIAAERNVIVYCDNAGEEERLRELIDQVSADVKPDAATPTRRIETTLGLIHAGFIWRAGDGTGEANDAPSTGRDARDLVLLPHHELFRRYTQVRRIRRTPTGRAIESFLDLDEGDYVVHIVHGIAKFTGMKTMRKADSRKSEEFLTLRFAEDATLHVPVSQIDLVQKYIGARGMKPPLSKLGGIRWQTTKARVEEALGDLASELLRIQADRASHGGVAFPEDTHWQREFEDAFLYPETPDQTSAMCDIKADQRRERPMDRLLCGDVGFGKTELAMRAAFKVCEYGKQTAVLVPTTVLADQHDRTFRERMADYPFRVECLNRFRSPKEQRAIIAAAKKGQVDILIGTHRLLSRDVAFADLGLAIIDEEQRFGVEHKERLKQLRTTVDVLTLSATPIPRTLHMAMVGLRDISSLATPPMDRRAITTQVTGWSDDLIREAVNRELNREGQVFFVHNRVRTIHEIATKIAILSPEARILVGHGQMGGEALEEVMLKFIRHEADILVCTTIIEAGLDIPNANTIFIDRADRFGLADLHQLRGRVGRYKHRAYCYLLLSPDRPLTDTAARRLKAIEEYSELGAGFRIAMRDLEIRGAGNILGSEQSGHIAAVGYELFCQLLEKQVKRMRGEPSDERIPVHLELDVEAYIPKSYVTSDRQRMDCYRRFVACRTPQDVEQLDRDLVDTFGPYPETVATQLSLTEIRVRAGLAGVTTIMKREPDVIFRFEGGARQLEPYFTSVTGQVSFPDCGTLHWRLPDHYFHGSTLLTVLRNLFRREATEISDPSLAPPQSTATRTKSAGTRSPAVAPRRQAPPEPRTGPIAATRNEYPADSPIHRKRRRKRP